MRTGKYERFEHFVFTTEYEEFMECVDAEYMLNAEEYIDIMGDITYVLPSYYHNSYNAYIGFLTEKLFQNGTITESLAFELYDRYTIQPKHLHLQVSVQDGNLYTDDGKPQKEREEYTMSRKELQKGINMDAERLWGLLDSISEYECIGRLRSCNARVYKSGNIYVLQSYNTIVAMIIDDICVDMSRKVYGYTRTTAQHIAKFRHDYGSGKWGCNTELRWYPL